MVLWAPWSDSNPSCLVQNLWESRAFLNRSFCVLEKTPFLLGNSSILPKPWSYSSIPSVDMFTSTLWSCLQILSLFGRVLIAKSSSFPKNAGWKNVSGLEQSFSQHRLNRHFENTQVGSTGEWFCHVLGVLGFSVVAPVHQTLHASDQPVLLLDLSFCLFNRRIVFSRRQLNRCSGRFNLLLLWTTAPVLWFC